MHDDGNAKLIFFVLFILIFYFIVLGLILFTILKIHEFHFVREAAFNYVYYLIYYIQSQVNWSKVEIWTIHLGIHTRIFAK